MNNIYLKRIILFSCLLCIVTNTYSQGIEDSTQVVSTQNITKDSYWKRLFQGNVDRTFEKKFDVSYIMAPSYTREASFGIGGMLSGLYRTDRTDSLMRPSDVTLNFNASLLGFYVLSMRGNNYFKGNRSLLSYEVAFTTKPLNFWGISYNGGSVNPVIGYTRQQIKIDANYQYKILKHFYIGSTLDISQTSATKIDDISYLEGQEKRYFATGIGVSVQYDSRDFIPNPKQGVYFMLRQVIFPTLLGNIDNNVYRTTFIANYYTRVWSGGVVATDLFGQFNSNNSPWSLRPELGGSFRMRGYYSGRYIDNKIASGQVELRQHLVQRFGCAFWFGGGSVFPTFDKFSVKDLLPTYGLGLRWEFKHNLNARIDYGFGKQTAGFVFNIGEAF